MSGGDWPRIALSGLDGLAVTFAPRLTEPANRAALALREAIGSAAWPEVAETAASLVSTYVRFDPLLDPAPLRARVAALVAARDWTAAPLPGDRRLIRIPTCYDGAHAPQLDEAAEMAGLTRPQAVEQLATAPLRVLAIGFAPGQPYVGELPPAWDIPRQRALTPRVPVGALAVAIRQLVLFAAPTPTGWRQVGQTAARPFDPAAAEPFLLRAGDALAFPPVDADRLAALARTPGGGISIGALA
nr:carboxyltransferase domain-containing protein [Paracoccus luteus]